MSTNPRLSSRIVPKAVALAVLAAVTACGLAVLSCPESASALPEIPASKFESAAACTCHNDQYNDWRQSMHAKALFDPIYVEKKRQANAASDGQFGVFCDTCHTPIGTMAKQTSGDGKLSAQSKQGVTCDFCHQVTGTTQPIGGASQKIKANGIKRAQYRDAASPTHKDKYSKFYTTAEFCGACHELRHPTTGAPLDTTYSDWKAGPYAEQGIVCQDCHMRIDLTGPPGPGTGRAAALGPIRDFVYRMTFAGANVGLGNAAASVPLLKSAATVSIDAPDVIDQGAAGEVSVTVANVGAGHPIPAGAAEIRQMWLEVNTVAADGTKKPLGERYFGTVFKDKDGKHPAQLWDAATVHSNDRIPAKGSVNSAFELKMDTEEPVSVEAVLYYKSVTDELARQAGVRNPVTEMARAEYTVYTSSAQQRRAEWGDEGIPGWPLYVLIGVAAVVIVVGGIAFVRRRRRAAKASTE